MSKRLPEELQTSPLLRPEERPRVPIAEPTPVRARQLFIIVEVARWALRTAWLWVTRKWTPAANARNTRELFERLGFLFIKAGQLLSLRTDFFSKEFVKEMSRLQYAAKGFPGEMARIVVEHELGGPIGSFFAEFDETPFAAASIAQLHRAVLRGTKQEVAIKVMRPFAPLIFEQDMKAIQFAASVLMRFNILPFLRWHEGVWELRQIVKEEVDYRYEVSNLKRMRKSLKKHKVYVPYVFAKLSTKTVLVMEMVHGALMTDLLVMRQNDPQRLDKWMEEHDIDGKIVGERLFLSFMRQLFEDEQFHGDLHPGNIILLRNSRFSLIDFGSVGSLERSFLHKYGLVTQAIGMRQYQKAADLLLALTPEFPVVDLVDIKEQMVRVMRAWELQTHVKSLPYEQKSLDKVVVDMVTILTQKKIMVSWEFMKIDRTWATLDASLNLLIPDVNYPRLFRRYFKQRASRMMRDTLTLKTIASLLVTVPSKLAELGLFIEPQIRKQGREFQGISGKFSAALAEIMGVWANTLMILDGLLVVGYMNRHYGWFKDFYPVQRFGDKFSIESDVMFGLIVLASYLFYVTWRVKRRLSAREIRLPSGNATVW